MLSSCSSQEGNSLLSFSFTPREENFLKGHDTEEVVQTLGKPNTILTSDPYKVWSYVDQNCVLFVFFDEDDEVCYAQKKGECLVDFSKKEVAGSENNGSKSNA